MDNILYKSTRGKGGKILSAQAILKGLAEDGGLYVPREIPILDKKLEELMKLDYKELAFYIMKKYLGDYHEDELRYCIEKAYDEKFDTNLIAPIAYKGDISFLELYHGPTLAFKDMALSILPYLLKTACKKLNIDKEVVILTATSGDTGKAALEGFANVEGTKIIVFYPEDGVSEIQKRQMITQEGENTFVIGIEGNFDDAQRAVKEIFSNRKFNEKINERGYIFSSANSINIGRLVPQIVYYFYGYLNLVKEEKIVCDEKINVVVPTGNFGNILAAYYARKMGLPINKLICASNENNVLYDFIKTGVYDIKRDFQKTISPSMDILVSSNLERLLYDISEYDESLINDLMEDLKGKGVYELPKKMKEEMKPFYGNYADDYETRKAINEIYREYNYLVDTHTAVAYMVYKKYQNETKDNLKTIIASTASPFKFTRSVMESIDKEYSKYNDFQLIKKMKKLTNFEVPKAVENLEERKILHKNKCKIEDIKETISKILGE